MVTRKINQIITDQLDSNKAIILIGCRQVGKTTILKEMFPENGSNFWFYGDDVDTQLLFSDMTAPKLRSIIGNRKVIVIDEAQRIPDIGLRMKIITDQMPDIRLLATSSSSFELANRLNEPLTGRKWENHIYPISFGEMVDHHGLQNEMRMLPHRMIYGYYPEVVTAKGKEKMILKQLSDSYLYKDILSFNKIKKSDSLIKLLQALAYQIGSQVSYNKLAEIVGIDAKTVETYIQLLEQGYIIFRLPSLSRNMRNELKHSRKIYFYDNGIRNALISNFASLELRSDVGALWENFFISERLKRNHYSDYRCLTYFWRTTQQQEIDYVEEKDGAFSIFEMKWNPNKSKTKFPESFLNNYAVNQSVVVTPENYFEFLRP